MAYELDYQHFLGLIQDKELKQTLSGIKLPDNSFYGETVWKTGKAIKVNISAKTSETNIKFLETKFKINRVGLNLELKSTNSTIRFIRSGKTSVSRNALGKKLADAGELATRSEEHTSELQSH